MNRNTIDKFVKEILKEDFSFQDITTNSLIHPRQVSTAWIITRQNCVLCGLDIAQRIFKHMDRTLSFKTKFKDGAAVKKGERLAILGGKTRAILSAERSALNILGHLCGVATLTRAYVSAVKPAKVQVLDTRKTTPTLRWLEKYAVRCGGGINHRSDLSETAFIKDNHLAVSVPHLSLGESIARLRKTTSKKIIVEVDTLEQLAEALLNGPDVVLLDNMPVPLMKKAVQMRNRLNKKVLLEASGGITLKSIKTVAHTGVERISVGALTHSAKAADLSLEIKPS